MKRRGGEGGDVMWLVTLVYGDYLVRAAAAGPCFSGVGAGRDKTVCAAPSVVCCTECALQHKHFP